MNPETILTAAAMAGAIISGLSFMLGLISGLAVAAWIGKEL